MNTEMKRITRFKIFTSALSLLILSAVLCGCDGEGGGRVTEEMAREAAKILKQWQDQSK